MGQRSSQDLETTCAVSGLKKYKKKGVTNAKKQRIILVQGQPKSFSTVVAQDITPPERNNIQHPRQLAITDIGGGSSIFGFSKWSWILLYNDYLPVLPNGEDIDESTFNPAVFVYLLDWHNYNRNTPCETLEPLADKASQEFEIVLRACEHKKLPLLIFITVGPKSELQQQQQQEEEYGEEDGKEKQENQFIDNPKQMFAKRLAQYRNDPLTFFTIPITIITHDIVTLDGIEDAMGWITEYNAQNSMQDALDD